MDMNQGYGIFFKFKCNTETRPFDQVEAALAASGIQDHHGSPLLQKPKPSTAFTRAMGFLTRVCTASISFPMGSPNAEWEENGVKMTGERNPNYSLKIEPIKSEDQISYRINISDRRCKDENMAHVLTTAHVIGGGVAILPSDQAAWDKFGADIAKLVNDSYAKFLNNYDDTDVRAIVDKELASLKAVHVLGYTTNFIAKDTEATPFNTERAKKLAEFVQNCGHLANILGLDATEMTRDALVAELRTSIMAELEEYEESLDAKLGMKTKDRQRGEKQRIRMLGTANKTIDSIMALAEYHAQVLGVIAEGITEKAAQLKAKAAEFLVKDFGDGTTTVRAAKVGDKATKAAMSDLEKKIAMLESENAKLKAEQAPAPVAAQVVVEEGQALFA